MRIYRLTVKNLGTGYNPVSGACNAFVLTSDSVINARKLAASNCSKEGAEIWLDDNLSECFELGLSKYLETKIILGNFQS